MLSSRKLSAVLLMGEESVYSEKYFQKSGACVSEKWCKRGVWPLSTK